MRYFRMGSYVLIFTGCSHLVGHFWPIVPANETESQLLLLMTSYQKEILGGKMSMMDIQNGLSLCYALFFLSFGLLNLMLSGINPSSLRRICMLNTITFAIGAVISLIYFFWLPVLSFSLAAVLFGFSVLSKEL